MKDLCYLKGYRYAHDFEGGIVAQQNLPENIAGKTYYQPTDRGFEQVLSQRLKRIKEIYARAQTQAESDAQEETSE
jgi:putative ATPase